jgi:hypothetical protein
MRGAMSIANRCRDRALLLQQVAQECLCPLFKARATALAAQWLIIAALVDQTGLKALVEVSAN